MAILPVILFVLFVSIVLYLSFYFAKKTKSAKGYFAAGGEIHWSVNGIAFAGDYLSAASFTPKGSRTGILILNSSFPQSGSTLSSFVLLISNDLEKIVGTFTSFQILFNSE